MSVKVNYKGEEILSVNTDATKTLKTSGKYCEGDIEVINTQDGGITPSGSQTFTENGTYDVTELAEAVVNVSGGGDSALVLDMDFEVPEATSAKQYITLSNLADLPNDSYKAWVGVFTYKGAYPTAPSKAAYVRTYCLAESHANSEFYMGKNLCLSDIITTAGGHDYYVQYGNQLQFDYIQRNKVAIVAPATQGAYQIPAGIWNLKLYTLGGGALT